MHRLDSCHIFWSHLSVHAVVQCLSSYNTHTHTHEHTHSTPIWNQYQWLIHGHSVRFAYLSVGLWSEMKSPLLLIHLVVATLSPRAG